MLASKKWWVWWIFIPSCFAEWVKYLEDHDAINIARCDAKCRGHSVMDECMDHCVSQNYTKPGNCPEENSMSPFEAACLVACSDDSQCPDFSRCCTNDCGVTCMKPTGLEERDDIPAIPDTLEIRRERSTKITLSWKSSKRGVKLTKHPQDLLTDGESSVRYVVEERHVLGPRYLESRLSSWSVSHVSSKPHAAIRVGLKTGHWYQFRVAAVNENGSRGYSQPSVPLKTAAPKNPREPRNLSLSGARVQPSNGKLRIVLRWRQPSSDIPIVFYKLFWSRFLRGPPNDSILVHHQSIPKEKNCYEIKNLEIGFQYFLQVQAVSLYGDRRLASRKASLVFNSTDYAKYVGWDGRSGRCERRRADLRVRRLMCQCANDVNARLIWPLDQHGKNYNVSWTQHCPSLKSLKHSKHHRNRSFDITKKTRYDIKGLARNCTYRAQVQTINSENNHNFPHQRILTIEFVTNNCKHRQSNNRNNGTSRCKKRKTRLKKRETVYF